MLQKRNSRSWAILPNNIFLPFFTHLCIFSRYKCIQDRKYSGMNQEYCCIARLRDTREAKLCIRQYLKKNKQTNKGTNKTKQI